MNMNDVYWRVLVGVSAPHLSSAMLHMDVTVPFIGQPVNVLVGACAGAVCGIGLAKPQESRRDLFWTALISVAFAVSTAAMVEGAVKFWFKTEIETKYLAALALMIALLGRKIVPAVIERLPGWLDKVPFFRNSKTPEGD